MLSSSAFDMELIVPSRTHTLGSASCASSAAASVAKCARRASSASCSRAALSTSRFGCNESSEFDITETPFARPPKGDGSYLFVPLCAYLLLPLASPLQPGLERGFVALRAGMVILAVADLLRQV